jgi:hypothetical protein
VTGSVAHYGTLILLTNQKRMQTKPDFEQYLASRLAQSWQVSGVDREELGKQLILSVRQLNALQAADCSAFHTRGIYLRSLRQALEQAQLLDEPEVLKRIEALMTEYTESPHTSHVLKVEQTVNRKLGVTGPDVYVERVVNLRGAIATVVLLLTVVLLVAILMPFD